MHMLKDTNDGQKRISKYLAENATPEVSSIPKTDEKPKKETPKNTEDTTYDYSDNPNSDDKEW